MKPRWLGRDTVLAPYMTLCTSQKEFDAVVKHCKLPHVGQWMDTDTHKALVHTWEGEGRLITVVCISPAAFEAEPIDVACTLVHEAVHIFQRLCDSIGEDHPSREFEAYSIERIAEQLMREFVRRLEDR